DLRWRWGSGTGLGETDAEHAIERSRNAGRVERLDQRAGEVDFPVIEECPQLLRRRPTAVGGLLLVRAKRAKLLVRVEDRLGSGDAQAANELVLEIALTDVEPEPLQPGAARPRGESRSLQRAPYGRFLALVTE